VETALVIVIGDAEPFEEIRREFAPWSIVRGIPFHITLLHPFAQREELTEALLVDLRSFFAARKPFEFELTRVAMWPRDVYAVPEPDGDLRNCMQALFALFPQWPPYGGIHPEVVPHATLAEDLDAKSVYPEIERRAAPYLPRRCQARDVALLEELEPARWRERERFPFGG
jgi:2'-5' RNA ligase